MRLVEPETSLFLLYPIAIPFSCRFTSEKNRDICKSKALKRLHQIHQTLLMSVHVLT